MSIRTFKPFINRKDMDSVLTTLVSEDVGYGSIGKEFASAVADYTGAESGFVLKEYERGIEAVFKSLEINEGDIVAVSALSSFYYKRVLDKAGIQSTVVDVAPETGIISLVKLCSISENVKAVIIDSPLGAPAEYDDLDEDIIIIEDISNTIGGGYDDVKCGSRADYIIMNMDQEKVITSGGGVFIGAGGKKQKERLRKSVQEMGSDKFLPDLNSALGLSLFSAIDKHTGIRNEIAENYISALMKSQHKTVLCKENSTSVYPFFPVIAKTSTKEIIKYALKKNIEVRLLPDDLIIEKYEIKDCPEAANLKLRCLIFPLYPNLGKKNIEHIVKVLTTLP